MIVIVGGGWAGLAAAVELTRRGEAVTLVESASRPGGRARRVTYRDIEVDNGQHLVLGAYSELRRLLTIIGVDERDVFERRALELHLHSRNEPAIRLRLPRGLPAPVHLLAGLVRAAGLSFNDKRRAITFCLRLRGDRGGADTTVRALLEASGQTPRLIRRLWEPLCLATLNTPIDSASAALFRRVLLDAFSGDPANSDMLVPRTDLGRIFPEPACRFVRENGGRVLLGRRATALEHRGDTVSAVHLAGGEAIAARAVILALPPSACLRLVRTAPALGATAQRLARLDEAPICTAYLQYPDPVALPFPIVGLDGSTGQWICDLAIAGAPGRMAVVISGPGPHMSLGREDLLARIADEVAAYFPDWPRHVSGFVLRERRATFLARAGVDADRPGAETALSNLYLAGDSTAEAGYPATLEGAVRSGVACARRVSVAHAEATESASSGEVSPSRASAMA